MTLSQQIESELSVFFDTNEFAVVASFTPASTGVSSSAKVQIITELTAYGDSRYTRIVGLCSELKDLSKDDIITIDGKSYGVVTSKADEFDHIMEVFLNE